jgi:hypothetical protein
MQAGVPYWIAREGALLVYVCNSGCISCPFNRTALCVSRKHISLGILVSVFHNNKSHAPAVREAWSHSWDVASAPSERSRLPCSILLQH